MKTNIRSFEDHQAIVLPDSLLHRVGISEGDEVDLSISSDGVGILITPASCRKPVRGRYNIDDLIAKDQGNIADIGEYPWGAARGKEIW